MSLPAHPDESMTGDIFSIPRNTLNMLGKLMNGLESVKHSANLPQRDDSIWISDHQMNDDLHHRSHLKREKEKVHSHHDKRTELTMKTAR